jgi:protein-tyrosine phosphatase
MIDIHSHILPGLDDEAASMEESIAMARCAVTGGIKQMVATPHVKSRTYPSRELILSVLAKLQKELKKNDIPLVVMPGGEYNLEPELPGRLARGEVLTINDTGRYLLVELPPSSVPDYTATVLKELQVEGVTPVIAHPERNYVFMSDYSRLYELVADGSLVQLTAGSLTGYYYTEVTAAARAFLEQGWVHFIASDAHNRSGQLLQFEIAAKEMLQLFGDGERRRLLVSNPQRALRGESIENISRLKVSGE